jgi:hypothetical protein
MFSGLSHGRRSAILILFLFCSIFFFQIYPHFIFTNEHSRLLLTSAIVDDQTVQIDKALQRYGDTQDKAIFNGHYYSDKAIGTSLLALPVYPAIKAIGMDQDATNYLFWLKLICVTLPSILFLIFITNFWEKIFNGRWNKPIAFIFAFGTIAFPYSLQFISHHLTGIALFLSFYFAYTATNSIEASTKNVLYSGVFAGAAMLLEYPAFLQAGLIFLYCVSRLRKRTLIFIAGTLPFLFLMLGYNYIIFQNPFDVTYKHMSDQIHLSQHSQGLVGFRMPDPAVFFAILFSASRGLFFFSPVLLFSIPGMYLLIRNPKFRIEGLLILLIVLSSLFFHSGMSNWDGGWSIGPRYLTPLLPFLMTAIAYFASTSMNETTLKLNALFLLSSLISIFFVTIGTITFPFPAPDIPNPVFSLFIPLFISGAFSKNIAEWLGIHGAAIGILFYLILLITYITLTVPAKEVRVPSLKKLAFAAVAVICFLLQIAMGVAYKPSHNDAFNSYALGSMYFYLGKCSHSLEELKRALNAKPDQKLQRWIIGRAWQAKMVCGPGKAKI